MMKKLLLVTLMLLLAALPAGADVIITEIMTNNGVFIDGERYDWIEIHNTGSKSVNISGYGLSDSKKNPMKWVFPEGSVLQGNAYAVIYCTDEDTPACYPKSSLYYAPFKLSDSGENIVLSNKQGGQLDLVKYPQMYGNTTWGLSSKGEWGFFDEQTPRKKNPAKVYGVQAERPVIETAPGFYTLAKGEKLTVTISGEGEIRYTLDGSTPTRSSKLYTGPFQVSKTTVVHAATTDADKLLSPTVGATYFINDPAPVSVLSVSTDREYLFDYSMGIFVRGSGNPSNYMKDFEYPMFIELFDEEGVRRIAQTGSFKVTGTSTRGYQQKSMALFARDAYGDENRFYHNPFDNRDYDSYKALLARNTGSDSKATRMRDVVLTSLAKGLGLMYQDAKPLIVYVNGEYWGQYNLREKVNKHSIAQWEGVTDPEIIDKIDVVEGEADDDEHVQNGSNEDWLELRAFVRSNDLNKPENLKYVTDRLDVDNFFTWLSLELGYRNADIENVRMYRVPGGKWKYVLYDLDDGGYTDMRALYMLLDSSRAGSRVSSQYSLAHKLLQVPEMKDRFLKIFAYVMEHSFLYESVVDPVMDQWCETLEMLLPRTIERYGLLTIWEWRMNANALRFALRTSPRRTILEVCSILDLTSAEQEAYFGRVLELMAVQNAEDKQ